MIPRELPRMISPSERHIFNLLAGCPNNWTVLHGIQRKIKSSRRGRVPGGETDFIVCIPDKGWLVLEIKGHGVTYHEGQWVRMDRRRRYHRLRETPLEQARANAYDMNKHLREVDVEAAKCPFFFTVAFPHETVRSPEHTPNNTISAEHCADSASIREAILRVIQDSIETTDRNPTRVSDRVIRNVISHFQTTLEQEDRMVLLQSEQEFVRLSDEQSNTLWGIGLIEKVLVEGPAGAGKTLIAMHIAKQAAERGLRTLVLTNTAGQREWLQLETYGTPSLIVERDDRWVDRLTQRSRRRPQSSEEIVSSLRNTLQRLTSDIEAQIERIEGGTETQSQTDLEARIEERDATLTELVDRALNELKSDVGEFPWDLLIWDEFQDYRYPSVACRLIREFKQAKVFADFRRQDWIGSRFGRDLRGALLEELGTDPEILNYNNRNTRNIASATERLTNIPTGPTYASDGLPVEVHYYTGDPYSGDFVAVDQLRNQLTDRITELPTSLGEFSGRIATIIDYGDALEEIFRRQSTIGELPIRRLGLDVEPQQPHVCLTDVQRFKGLESPAVFLIYPEPDPDPSDPVRPLVNYSAPTRARSLLCIFTPEANRPFFEERLPDALHSPPRALAN